MPEPVAAEAAYLASHWTGGRGASGGAITRQAVHDLRQHPEINGELLHIEGSHLESFCLGGELSDWHNVISKTHLPHSRASSRPEQSPIILHGRFYILQGLVDIPRFLVHGHPGGIFVPAPPQKCLYGHLMYGGFSCTWIAIHG